MKKNVMILIGAFVLLACIAPLQADIFTDIGDGFRKAGEAVVGGVARAGKAVYTTLIKPAEKEIEKGAKEVEKAAKEVEKAAIKVGKEVEKAAEEVGKAVVKVGEEFVKGVEQIGACVAYGTAEATLEAAKGVVSAADVAAQGLSAVVKAFGSLTGQVFNVEKITIKQDMAGLAKIKFPEFTVKGKLLGKSVSLKVQLDPDPIKMAENAAKQVGEIIKSLFK